MTKLDEFKRRAREGASNAASASLPGARAAGQALGRTLAREVAAFETAEREHYNRTVPDMLLELVRSVALSIQPNRPVELAVNLIAVPSAWGLSRPSVEQC
jgi:hypothetical protein